LAWRYPKRVLTGTEKNGYCLPELLDLPVPAAVDPEEDVPHTQNDEGVENQDKEQEGVARRHFLMRLG
jgi:hypothetical protein